MKPLGAIIVFKSNFYYIVYDMIFLHRYYPVNITLLFFLFLFLGKIKIKMSKAISTFIVHSLCISVRKQKCQLKKIIFNVIHTFIV